MILLASLRSTKGPQKSASIISPIINPDEDYIPTGLSSGRQGEAFLSQIGRVLDRVEIELITQV
jgi:hypothetical protein